MDLKTNLTLDMFKPRLPSRKTNTLGVDIGTQSVKVVRLSVKESQKPKFEFAGILESSPSDPQFANKFKDFISKNKLSDLNAAVSIEDKSLKIRKLELPKMPDADLKEAVKWKMRDVVEGNIEDFVVRSSIVSGNEPDSKKLTLVGYAIKKASVTHAMKHLSDAGLRPVFVEPSAVSLASSIDNFYPSDDMWLAGLDLGYSKSTMIIIGRGKYYFSRPLPGISIQNSEQDAENFNPKLAAEIQNTLDTFAVTFQVEQINQMFLSGGGSNRDGLLDYLTKNLGLKSTLLDPFSFVDISPDKYEKIEGRHLYAPAVALAMITQYD
ncbi:pilus assembly protein PilM [bacterium]|nr:pilus assembly protein PilM [bacterium]